MIRITERARERLARLIDHLDDEACLRLSHAGGSPLAPDYDLAIVDLESRGDGDRLIDADGIRVLVDAAGPEEVTIDFLDAPGASGFQVRPAGDGGGGPAEGSLTERVQRVIDEKVNPGVASHGGHITLREVRDDVAVIEMAGGCQGCTLSRA